MVVLYLTVVVVLLLVAYTCISAAPWVPTRKFDVDSLLDDAGVNKGTNYIELGCGDGRLVKAAAKRGANAIGYELNPVMWLIATVNNLGVKNTKIIFKDFWKVDLSKADVVMAFILPRTIPRLDTKAKKELGNKALLVSYIFPILGRKPLNSGKSWFVYSYAKKLKD